MSTPSLQSPMPAPAPTSAPAPATGPAMTTQETLQQQLQALELRDIHAPGEPPLWPPAPGWWLLAVLAVAGLITVARLLGRRLHRQRRRRHIVGELDRLAAQVSGPTQLAGISGLLKRVALSRFPRLDVAALKGQDWLEFLDRTGGDGRFAAGPGRVLADGPYAPQPDYNLSDLVKLSRDWLMRNS